MILLVCGGRHFANRDAVFAALDRVHAKRPVTRLVHGGATGADAIAGAWAAARGIQCRPYAVTKGEWIKFGAGAGPMRNARMLADAQPQGVVAFPGGTGTADMVRRARDAGVLVWQPQIR